MKDSKTLTPAEFEVMAALWRRCPASVSDVLEAIRQEREVAYTTVMTVLDKLAQKGTVTRRKKGKAFFYTPAVERIQVLDRMVRQFASHYFDGDTSKLRAFLSNGAPSKPKPNGRALPPTKTASAASSSEVLEVALL